MIEWINFTPEWSAPLGLAGGPLRDLGDVVVLTGPNGGGKTRYLQLLIQVWARYRKLLLRKNSLEAFGKLRERARAGTATDADVLEQSPILLHAFYSYLTHGLLPTDPTDTATGAEPLPSLRQVVSNIDGMIPQVGLRPGGIERALEHGALPRTVILKYHRVDYGYYYRDVEGGDLCRDDEVNVKSSHENEKLRRVRMFRVREELERKLDGLARLVYMQEHPRFASTHVSEIERAMGVWRLLETWLGQPLTVESPGADGYRVWRWSPRLAEAYSGCSRPSAFSVIARLRSCIAFAATSCPLCARIPALIARARSCSRSASS